VENFLRTITRASLLDSLSINNAVSAIYNMIIDDGSDAGGETAMYS
jgi:hypothetical protein